MPEEAPVAPQVMMQPQPIPQQVPVAAQPAAPAALFQDISSIISNNKNFYKNLN